MRDCTRASRFRNLSPTSRPENDAERSCRVSYSLAHFSLLFGFGFLAYVQQKTITVAAAPMMRISASVTSTLDSSSRRSSLGTRSCRFRAASWARTPGRAGHLCGDRSLGLLGHHCDPIARSSSTGRHCSWRSMAVQLVLGLSQGAIFPVSAGVFEAWLPRKIDGPSSKVCRPWDSVRLRVTPPPHRVSLTITPRVAASPRLGQLARATGSSWGGALWAQFTA